MKIFSLIIKFHLIVPIFTYAQFAPEQLIQPLTLVDPIVSISEDIDGDGDVDILIGSTDGGDIAWIENLGNNEFSTQHIISSEINSLGSIFASDLSGDGLLDVMFTSINNDEVGWYENLGNGVFGQKIILSTVLDGPDAISSSDLDGDSDMDIVIGTRFGSAVVWLENLGSNNFSSEQIVKNTSANVMDLKLSDLDGDGDNDVVIIDTDQDEIIWFENLSPGNFSNENVITDILDGITSIHCADINGDGQLDIVSSSFHDHKVAWYKNLGGGLFSSQMVISTVYENISHVNCSDLDDDGALDILFTSLRDDKVAWIKNLGSDNFSALTDIGLLNEASSVSIGDFNSDGDQDVISLSRGNHQVYYYDNLGSGTFTQGSVISTSAFAVNDVYATDLDNDGDMDVLSASSVDRKIAWYENLGNGFFSKQKDISLLTSNAESVYSADLDGDGDQDVLSASSNDDKIAWYENLGAGNFSSQNIITNTENGASSVFSEDLDGDGDMDVLSAAMFSSRISWYENLGSGNFSAAMVISTGASRAQSVFAIDLDNDGDIDVLSASSNDDEVSWYENFGNGTFSGQNELTDNAEGAWCVFSADLDNDGDNDIISASTDDDKIAWFENFGEGRFSNEIILTTDAIGVKSVYSADIDNDGDLDIIAGSSITQNVSWFENKGLGFFEPSKPISMDGNATHFVHCADLDNDGDADVISGIFEGGGEISWFKNLNVGGVNIQGKIYQDIDSNCINDDNGLPILANIIVTPGPYYTRTDSLGNYSVLVDTGNYTISPINDPVLDEFVRSICPPTYQGAFVELGNDTTGFDFGLNVEICQNLEVNLTSNRRRRCFRSNTTLEYCNNGLVKSEPAELKVIYPEYVVPISSSIPWETKVDSILSWSVGELQPRECKYIDIIDSVICGNESIRGLTQCTKAIISPNIICDSIHYISSGWDESDISLISDCNVFAEEIDFTIGNNPDAMDMLDSGSVQVFFNDTLVKISNYKLKAGEKLHLIVPSHSQTVRVDVLQNEFHPIAPKIREIIETCYTPVIDLDTGFVTSVGPLNNNSHEYTSCMEIIDSYDPNDKMSIPEGRGVENGILIDELIEYTIRFQNTGTDTAFKVIITDTLDLKLDISTIRFGASSHESVIYVSGYNRPVVTWVFDNILLPDSTTDNLGSNGFVKFRVKPKPTISTGDIIENMANIYFDYNSPIITNTTNHKIISQDPIDLAKGSSIIQSFTVLSSSTLIEESDLMVFPNPIDSGDDFYIIGNSISSDLILLDITGKEILNQPIIDGTVSFGNQKLPAGMYFYRIVNRNGQEAVGRLVIK